MSTGYNQALKDEIVDYVTYLLKNNSQKAEMTEEQLRKRYVTAYGRPLHDDLSMLHMSISEVLALARAKNVSQRSNVSETVVEKPPVPQKQEVSAVSKAPEQHSKAMVQKKIVEKEVVQKQSADKPSLLNEKETAKIVGNVSSDSEEFLSSVSSERNSPISINSTDVDKYCNKRSPTVIDRLPPYCHTPIPWRHKSPESTPQVTAPSTVSDQLNSCLSQLSLTSPMSYKSVMNETHFMSMSPHPARLSSARQMHNVIQQIILDVEQSIKKGLMKIRECLNASDNNITQSLTSDEFYRCYSKCIPERQRLTRVQLQRLLNGLVDAANCVEDAYNDEL
ncbi:hypothetical protein M3Y98_00044500 [Aphelenchoides besseyi]|nr:hypothetical protein M3Y98_00044500 [Aphelenchoides besseyi]